MAVIKGGDSTDQASVHPIPKALHVINYSSDGHEGIHSFPSIVTTNNATQLNEFVLPSLNSEEYKFISIQLVGTWVATITFEGSNDNTTFYSIATTDPAANRTGQTTATINRIVKVPVLTKYIRARVSDYTSGIISAVAYGHKDENSSGLISTLGEVTLKEETTKIIGTVNLNVSQSPLYHKIVSGVGLNQTLVKASAGKISILHLVNSVATTRYFKMFNQATVPNVPTDVSIFTVSLPTGATTFTLPSLAGIDFSVGISYAITLNVDDSAATPDTVLGAVTGLIAFV
tara:strand:- start:737 stop:1600 length:864 start_codon:yes stop_codon:yes gene_type:complete